MHWLSPKTHVPHPVFLLQVSFVVDCRWVQDMLKGAECYEMRIRLKEHRVERYPLQDDD